jgi:hypothetical protein
MFRPRLASKLAQKCSVTSFSPQNYYGTKRNAEIDAGKKGKRLKKLST